MKITRAVLLFSLGFFVAAALKPLNVLKAQGTAHVFIVPVQVFNLQATAANIPGVRIAGISCLPKPTAKLPNAAVCYVATTLSGN